MLICIIDTEETTFNKTPEATTDCDWSLINDILTKKNTNILWDLLWKKYSSNKLNKKTKIVNFYYWLKIDDVKNFVDK